MQFLNSKESDDDSGGEEKLSLCRLRLMEAQTLDAAAITTCPADTTFIDTIENYATSNTATILEMDSLLSSLQTRKRQTVEELFESLDIIAQDCDHLEVERSLLLALEAETLAAQENDNTTTSSRAIESLEIANTINNLQQFINRPNYAPHLQNMRQFDSLFEASSEEVKGAHRNDNSSDDHSGHEFRLRQSAKENLPSDITNMTETTLQRIHLEVLESNYNQSYAEQEKILESDLNLQDEMYSLQYDLNKFNSDLDSLLDKI